MDPLESAMVEAGYRIDGTLGEGGMGAVYRATQLSLQRVVALKVLTVELSSDPAFRERFRREGLLQAALDHPHIVTVFEAGEAGGRLFLAMRMVEGPTLKELIQRRQLDDRRALRLLTQVAEALDAAHERGLIHRDVKPHNVLVGAGDHAYLADFGLTKAKDDQAMTETGQFVGTIDYISPEQARGEQATAQSDVYALTAVLFECLTGQVPYVRPTEDRVLLAHLSDPPPRVSELRSDLPHDLDGVIAAGMAKDPADRPASAGELMLRSRQALGTVPATPAMPASATPPASVVDPSTRAAATVTAADAGATRLAAAATPAAAATRPAAPAAVGEPPSALPAAAPGTRAGARRGRLLPVAVAAAALAALVGFLLGGGSGGSGERFASSASAGSLELSFPSSWQRLASVPAIPGLALSQPLALSAGGAGGSGVTGERLLAGEASASGASLLPSAFTAAIGGTAPSGEAVRLGALEAYRYQNLSVHGLSGSLTLYVVPTTSGVATIACLGPAAGTPATQCAQIAATLKLSGASAFALGPSSQYAATLTKTFSTLQSAVSAGATDLRAASSASTQADAATKLAAAYGSAASALSRLSLSPVIQGVNEHLAASLSALGHDYGALAQAAREGSEAAYRHAGAAIAGDQAHAERALAALRQAGYAVSG